MPLSKYFISSLKKEISERLKNDCFSIYACRLNYNKETKFGRNIEIDYEETLRQLMVVHFRRLSEKNKDHYTYSKTFECLCKIFNVSKKEDLRFFDAWNNIFEVTKNFEDFPYDMRIELIIKYRDLLMHYCNLKH